MCVCVCVYVVSLISVCIHCWSYVILHKMCTQIQMHYPFPCLSSDGMLRHERRANRYKIDGLTCEPRHGGATNFLSPGCCWEVSRQKIPQNPLNADGFSTHSVAHRCYFNWFRCRKSNPRNVCMRIGQYTITEMVYCPIRKISISQNV